MQLNDSLFDINGASGYVLKPDKMKSKKLHIEIISGQQIGSKSMQVLLEVQTDKTVLKFKTKECEGNLFNSTFECLVKEFLCFLKFEVLEDNAFFGGFCISLECLNQGYRHIPLHDKVGGRLGGSTLFVKILIE
jgi:hypothetical protein